MQTRMDTTVYVQEYMIAHACRHIKIYYKLDRYLFTIVLMISTLWLHAYMSYQGIAIHDPLM